MEIVEASIPNVNLSVILLLLLLVFVEYDSVSTVNELKPLPFLILRCRLPFDLLSLL